MMTKECENEQDAMPREGAARPENFPNFDLIDRMQHAAAGRDESERFRAGSGGWRGPRNAVWH